MSEKEGKEKKFFKKVALWTVLLVATGYFLNLVAPAYGAAKAKAIAATV